MRVRRGQRNRHEILGRVVGQLGHQQRVGHIADGVHENRVPVGGRLCDSGSGNGGRTAGLVFEQHRLAERGAQVLARQAQRSIERTSGRVGHHEADGLVRELRCGLRGGKASDQAGNQLNQNGNAINGETPADQYRGVVNFLATNTFPATGLPSPVKDYTVNTYPLNVPNNMPIGAVRVQINVSHGWMSDMVIKLRSPSGAEVLLANRRGSGGKGYNNTIFDDSAAKALIQGGGLFQGTFRPEAPLAAFKGSSTGGIWTLVIEDKARGDAGTLLGWSLTFDAASGASSVSSAPSRSSSVAAELSRLVTTQPATASLTSLSQVQSISFAHAHTQLAQGIHASTTTRPADNIVIKKQQQQLLQAWQEELATAMARFRATI